jgi:hypothetical protein
MLDNKMFHNIISWKEMGDWFIIKNIEVFESEVLPKYFRHKNFTSFLRQLNMYSFIKIREDKYYSFSHKLFKRSTNEFSKIIRRKNGEINEE